MKGHRQAGLSQVEGLGAKQKLQRLPVKNVYMSALLTCCLDEVDSSLHGIYSLPKKSSLSTCKGTRYSHCCIVVVVVVF